MQKSFKKGLRKGLRQKIGNFLGQRFISSFMFAVSVVAVLMLIAEPSQALNVTATVDRNEMHEGDTFTLTLSVESEKQISVEPPRLPNLKGFDLMQSWQGSEMRSHFINGKRKIRRVKNFNYMLVSQKTGQFQIEALEVVVNGRAFRTKPISIEVLTASASRKNQSQRPSRPFGNDPFDDADQLFSQFFRNRINPRGGGSKPPNLKDSFFIKTEVDKTEVYEGEQVVVSWYLYTRGQISDVDTLKHPSLNGFWKEDIEVATRLNFSRVIVNGLVYQRALLASYALFPIKSGVATIDDYKIRAQIMIQGAFGFGRPYLVTKSSKEVQVKVLPLPTKGRPLNFTGAIGQFNVKARLDTDRVEVDQAVTMTVDFSGRGNGKMIDLPPLNLPSFVEVYDTKTEAKFYKDGTSSKTFEVLLIPRKAGKVEIEPIVMSLFDPVKASFYQRKTPELSFVVTSSSKTTDTIPSKTFSKIPQTEAVNSPIVEVPGLILNWKEGDNVLSRYSGVFIILGYLFALLFLLWKIFVEFSSRRSQQNINEHVRHRFKKIAELQAQGQWRTVGTEVLNLFYYLIGEISDEGGASTNIEILMDKVPPSVRRELGESLKKMLAKFEVLSFAPEEIVGPLKEEAQLKTLVKDMEKLLYRSVELGLGERQMKVLKKIRL